MLKLVAYNRIFCSVVMIIMNSVVMWCVPSEHFAKNSKLSTGKWAKIEIPCDGVYELTADELTAVGFPDITKIKIFGNAGTMLPESLEAVTVDDLTQVPVFYASDKICFWGEGPMSRSYNSSNEPMIKFTANSYSSASYYFITDGTEHPIMEYSAGKQSDNASNIVPTSYGVFHHERELCTPSNTGKTFLGEDFGTENVLNFKFDLPNYVEGSLINLYVSVAAKLSEKAKFDATLNSSDVKFAVNTNQITQSSNEFVYYMSSLGRGSVTPVKSLDGKFNLNVKLNSPGTTTMARLDYYTLTYQQRNALHTDSSQLDMVRFGASSQDKVVIEGVTSTSQVLDVTNSASPKIYTLHIENGRGYFTPDVDASSVQRYILFDYARELHHVSSIKPILNQNLHSIEDVPEMVIITTSAFKEQARRIAEMHKSRDDMSVAIVEQEQIFNEFSSGTPDAMAIRMFMKMLYQRDASKLKYLLLFGGGSVDNRRLIGKKSDNLLLTYQSTVSNDETRSYTCDNFFGMLADNCGYSVASMPVSVAVGRMPVKTVEEAENAVDKLLDYVADDDFSDDWRNNVVVVADRGDNDIHMYQAENVIDVISQNTSSRPLVNRIYNAAYPLTDEKAVDARRKLAGEFKRGQIAMTYIGHSGPMNLTKLTNLWRLEDVKNVTYKHLPFVSFASCDVARFDSDVRGIGEEMFHQRYGGMIAGMVTTRVVYVSDNDVLNTAMLKALFSTDENGSQRTIGDAFRISMQAFGNNANTNKLNFQLLGDPAMKLNYPQQRVVVSTVNGTDVSGDDSEAQIYPLSKVVITGYVNDRNGKIDKDFNGGVVVSLLDKQRKFKTVTLYEPNRDVYNGRELLAKADGQVASGKFSVELAVPRNCLAQDENGAISVYAYKADGSKCPVNGWNENVVINSYSKKEAIIDNQAPVIAAMYLNSESFSNGDAVLENPMLHIDIADDCGICVQSLSLGGSIKLLLDGGNTSYCDAKNVVNIYDSGKKATINIQLDNLSYGKHCVTLYVGDVAGNQVSRTIDFFVKDREAEASLFVDEKDVRYSAVFNLEHNFNEAPVATIFVLDGKGDTVWQTSTSDFPYEWNLTDRMGKRVASGLYRYYSILSAGNQTASSKMRQLVILNED